MLTKQFASYEKNSLLKNIFLGNLQGSEISLQELTDLTDSLFGGTLNSTECLDCLLLIFKKAGSYYFTSEDFVFLIKYFNIDIVAFIKKIFKQHSLWSLIESEIAVEVLTPMFIEMVNDRANNVIANEFFTEYFYNHVYDRRYLTSFYLDPDKLIANGNKIIDWFASTNLRKYRSGNIKDMLTKFPKEIFHTTYVQKLRRDFQLRLLEHDFENMYQYVIREDVSDDDIREIFFKSARNDRSNNFNLSSVHALETKIFPKKNMRSVLFKDIASRGNSSYQAATRLKQFKNINELDIPHILSNTILSKQEFNNLMRLYETEYTKYFFNINPNAMSVIESYFHDIDNLMSYDNVSEYRKAILVVLILKKVKPLLMKGLRTKEVSLSTYHESFKRYVARRLTTTYFKNAKYNAMKNTAVLKLLNGVYFKSVMCSVAHYDREHPRNIFIRASQESKNALSFLLSIDSVADKVVSKNLILDLHAIKT